MKLSLNKFVCECAQSLWLGEWRCVCKVGFLQGPKKVQVLLKDVQFASLRLQGEYFWAFFAQWVGIFALLGLSNTLYKGVGIVCCIWAY